MGLLVEFIVIFLLDFFFKRNCFGFRGMERRASLVVVFSGLKFGRVFWGKFGVYGCASKVLGGWRWVEEGVMNWVLV